MLKWARVVSEVSLDTPLTLSSRMGEKVLISTFNTPVALLSKLGSVSLWLVL